MIEMIARQTSNSTSDTPRRSAEEGGIGHLAKGRWSENRVPATSDRLRDQLPLDVTACQFPRARDLKAQARVTNQRGRHGRAKAKCRECMRTYTFE
jgi:hypothetical protein